MREKRWWIYCKTCKSHGIARMTYQSAKTDLFEHLIIDKSNKDHDVQIISGHREVIS